MLSTSQVSFKYRSANRVFQFPDIQCEAGKAVLILGPSGCGKTTLLHLLAGLLIPDSGSIQIAGQEFQKLPMHEHDRFRAAHIGLVLQKPHFLNALNITENLQLFQKLSGRKKDVDRIIELLKILDLSDKAKQLPNSLSQGEAQRLSLARAVINQPALLLADEPTSSLDDKRALVVAKLLSDQAEIHKASLVVVSHDSRLKDYFETQILLT
ncbi:MAG: ATP-binding cassette domain-containing protein [Saprospiraceae bacterium]|nr:ATP-binding cassette domain-containing protein [Saprospiraceae bacterium]